MVFPFTLTLSRRGRGDLCSAFSQQTRPDGAVPVTVCIAGSDGIDQVRQVGPVEKFQVFIGLSPGEDARATMMRPEDVAEVILMCAAMPQRTLIREVVMTPTVMRDRSADLEVARKAGAPQT